jgi:xylulokinase
MVVMGLDVGTTGVKSVVYDGGKALASAYCEYGGGGAVLDPETLWLGVRRVIREAAGKAPPAVIGISSFGESFVPVDAYGRALDEILLYTHKSGAEACGELETRLGESLAETAGARAHPMYTLPKLMWLRKRKPDVFSRMASCLLIEDYIIFRLTGRKATDYSLAARTLAFDIRRKAWSPAILEAAGMNAGLFPEPLPPGTIVERVRPEVCEELGLPRGTKVSTGGHDQVCAAVGAGALAPGASANGMGTVECVTPVFDRPETGEPMRRGGYACVPFATEGNYATYAFCFTGGALLKWYRDRFAAREAAEAKRSGTSAYALLDAQVGKRPSGLLLLPHFAGAGTPWMDDRALGAIAGLTLDTEPVDIYRAIMEGVAYEMRLNLEMLGEAGIEAGELRATGGGASSPVWLQIKADILNRRITALEDCQAGAVGCVALAAKASGEFTSLGEAVACCSKPGKVYEPDARRAEEYRGYYEKYRLMYGAVKALRVGDPGI